MVSVQYWTIYKYGNSQTQSESTYFHMVILVEGNRTYRKHTHLQMKQCFMLWHILALENNAYLYVGGCVFLCVCVELESYESLEIQN